MSMKKTWARHMADKHDAALAGELARGISPPRDPTEPQGDGYPDFDSWFEAHNRWFAEKHPHLSPYKPEPRMSKEEWAAWTKEQDELARKTLGPVTFSEFRAEVREAIKEEGGVWPLVRSMWGRRTRKRQYEDLLKRYKS